MGWCLLQCAAVSAPATSSEISLADVTANRRAAGRQDAGISDVIICLLCVIGITVR